MLSLIPDSLDALSILKGPEPIGAVSKAFDASASAVFAFGRILMTAIRSENRANGYFSLNSAVVASLAVTESMNDTKPCISGGALGSAGLRTRVKDQATSSAVTGVPSENLAPSRSRHRVGEPVGAGHRVFLRESTVGFPGDWV